MTEDQNLSEEEANAAIQEALAKYAVVLKRMGAGLMPKASEVSPAMDLIRNELARMRALVSTLYTEQSALIREKNGAYRERNNLVAALAKLYPASIEKDSAATSMEWVNVVIIDFPTGQVSWHIHQSDLEQFSFLPTGAGRKWDGHTTEEKYRRIAALSKIGYWVGGFATGPDGLVMTSPDGTVLVSTDGVTWTKRREPSELRDPKSEPHQ